MSRGTAATSIATTTASGASDAEGPLARLLIAGLVLLGACAAGEAATSTTTTTPAGFDPVRTTVAFAPVTAPSTTTTITGPSAASTTSTTATAGSGDPDEALLGQLVVAPEHLGGYDRDRFEHWIDADRDGCNTRCEVLEAERRPSVGWVSTYDGFVTTDPRDLEIDHVVALAEAWRSGAHAWDDARREAFANDLDEPAALVAVSSASNQSKADKDPAEWRPPLRGAWCGWARGWATVKVRWGLTVDQRELAALRQVLADC